MDLVYTSDQMPGYRRIRRGQGFSYRLPDGSMLQDRAERRRIHSLAIPPAYEDVWICLKPNGHLQATGFDERGRKQYRYHPAWHERAARRKFGELTAFALALPRIRASVRREMARKELTRERVLAGVVSLLDLTGYRIGNARYVRDNQSFGVASLLARHLREVDGELRLEFNGKSGQEHRARIVNPSLTRLLGELQELPGQTLFCYVDEAGQSHEIGSGDVNAWIKEIAGGDFTSKQFRTWRATVLCARELARSAPPATPAEGQRRIREAVAATAARLNHTPATCRKYYLHPALFRSYHRGMLHQVMNRRAPRLRKADGTAALHAEERRVFQLLERGGAK